MQHSINYADNLFHKQKTAVILLQPTSPLRDKDDIKKAIDVFEKGKYDSLFSAYKDKIFFWKYKDSKLISVNYSYKNRMKTGYMKKKKKQNSFIVENGNVVIGVDNVDDIDGNCFGNCFTFVDSFEFKFELNC